MDFEMLTSSLPSTSSAASGMSASHSVDNNCCTEYDEENDSLWSIDDTLFFPAGLMNHSAEKGKSVFVTWNENYLLNFVFKTSSKSQKTTLTKVRLSMPVNEHENNPEEIVDILILEMNTLLLMKSGRVYCFSSVKSIHNVHWLKDVYSITSLQRTQFSTIRFINDTEQHRRQLLLEVYQDIPELWKCPSGKDVLRHSYDISFDTQNLFNCDWRSERYILLSFITDFENTDFLKSLVAIGNLTRAEEEKVKLEQNQEVHIFAISGNMFILVGALGTDNGPSHPEIEDYTIQLVNTYTAPIESVQIDFRKDLLMVLLQSGHMDIWYKSSHQMLRHLNHEIAYFTHYDYNPSDNTYYLTKPEEVTQLRIIYNKEQVGNECMIREKHKAVSGMIACTWVESLQQLITLSINNIYYRLCFDAPSSYADNVTEADMEYENLNVLYALTTKKIKELLCRAQIVKELAEQPSRLHEAVELEWQKQQLLSLGFKKKLWRKLLKCRLEYHLDIPTTQYFVEDLQIIRTSFDQNVKDDDQNIIYSLIYLTLNKKDGIFLSIIETASWQLQIYVDGKSLLLQIPSDMIHKNLCFIVKYSMRNRYTLPDFCVNLLTFIRHCSVYICVNFDVDIIQNEKTYHNIFSYGVQQIPLFHDNNCNVEYLIQECNKSSKSKGGIFEIAAASELKQIFKISKQEYSSFLIHYKHINTNSKLHFLRQYSLHLNYDETQQLLVITSRQPEALFYIKVLLMYHLKLCENINVNLTESKSLHQTIIMQYQCDIERLYGTLMSPEYMDGGSGTTFLQLENLFKVYSKLRCEFNEIFR